MICVGKSHFIGLWRRKYEQQQNGWGRVVCRPGEIGGLGKDDGVMNGDSGNGGGNSASLGEGSNVGTVGQRRCSVAWLLAGTVGWAIAPSLRLAALQGTSPGRGSCIGVWGVRYFWALQEGTLS